MANEAEKKKAPYKELLNIGTRVLTVFAYYEYAVLDLVDKGEGKEPELVERLLAEPFLRYGSLTKLYDTIDDEMAAIRAYVSKRCIADVIVTTIYQIFIPEKDYKEVTAKLEDFTQEEVNLSIFREHLFDNTVLVRGTFPLVFEEKYKNGKYKS